MKKITLTEFWNSTEKLAIHCDTEEKANKLLMLFDKLGKNWSDGNSYLEYTYYDTHKQNTCYSNYRMHTKYNWYKNNGYKIYEFEDVDLENYGETKMKKLNDYLKSIKKEEINTNDLKAVITKLSNKYDELDDKANEYWNKCFESDSNEDKIIYEHLANDYSNKVEGYRLCILDLINLLGGNENE